MKNNVIKYDNMLYMIYDKICTIKSNGPKKIPWDTPKSYTLSDVYFLQNMKSFLFMVSSS